MVRQSSVRIDVAMATIAAEKSRSLKLITASVRFSFQKLA
jgi:hypothetical protein